MKATWPERPETPTITRILTNVRARASEAVAPDGTVSVFLAAISPLGRTYRPHIPDVSFLEQKASPKSGGGNPDWP